MKRSSRLQTASPSRTAPHRKVEDAQAALRQQTEDALRACGARTSDIRCLRVPGRVEVFGKHTDYCGGRSLLIATQQGLTLAVAPRADSTVTVRSLERGAAGAFEMSPELSPRVGDWLNYPMTVARRVARNFPGACRGCDIVIGSDLPQAAGLSSSSALITGLFFAIAHANDLPESPRYQENLGSPEQLACYLGAIENGSGHAGLAGDRGVGTTGGSQDHTAITLCRSGTLSQFGFCPVRRERDIAVASDLRFVISVSGVVAEKTGAALHRYNAVAAAARTLLDHFNGAAGHRFKCLNDALASSSDAEARMLELAEDDATLRNRLRQFIEESLRIIPAAADAIAASDHASLGTLADRSQRLAEECLGNQVPQTVDLQRAARACGALAASAFGAGFGGSVWALVPAEQADSFTLRWRESLDRGSATWAGRAAPTFFTTAASGGIAWLP